VVEKRPSFAHILRLLRDRDDPLFPGMDMTVYGDYRRRILDATSVAADDAHILQQPAIREDDRTEFAAKLALAQAGDGDAMLRVGSMYEKGIGTQIDQEQAFAFFLAAAEKGISLAKLNVALCYLKGRGTAASNVEGLRWLEDAIKDPRMPDAKYQLGALLVTSRRDATQIRRGLALLREVQGVFPDAQYLIASALEDGLEGTPPNYAEVRRLYEAAAAGGVEPANVDLANMYLKGTGVARDIEQGIRILTQASVKEVEMAMCNLGDLYSVDTYGRKDIENAKRWYKKAVDVKCPLAMLKLAVLLRREALACDGDQQLQLNRESAMYMKDAATAEDGRAMVNFGKFLLEGIGVPVDVPQAVQYLTAAVAKGVDQARFLLGQVLYEGRGGLARNPDTALELWRAAAANGHAESAAAVRRYSA
jgi:TPR repeat protein